MATDDELFDQWVHQLRQDRRARETILEAVRSKEASAVQHAVEWVVVNIVKPVQGAWASAVAWVKNAFGL